MASIVLVPLDGSEKDDRALEAGGAVAELSGGSIHLLRVLATPIESISHRGRTMGVAAAARDLRTGMERNAATQAAQVARRTGRRVTSEVAENFDVAAAILDRANDGKTEFIVMATRAAGAVGRALRGSVADPVMRASTRPVFLVPPRSAAVDKGRLERVLVPLDGSALAVAAIDAMLKLERSENLDYLLVEVITAAVIDNPGAQGIVPAVLPQTARAHEDAEERLNDEAKRLRAGRSRSVELRVVQDADPAMAITRIARESKVDFIAMTTRGHGGLKRLLLGSVAEGIVRESEIPVLLFPTVVE